MSAAKVYRSRLLPSTSRIERISARLAAWVSALALLAAWPIPASPQGPLVPATVRRVADGDTVIATLQTPGRGLQATERIRLVGIDCPESRQRPWGPRATARLRQLVDGRPVTLEVALQSRDRYGRLLAAVWLERTLVQEVLVREGLCLTVTVPPNVQHADRLRRAQQEARQAGRGLWSPTEGLRESPAEYRPRRR